MYVKVYMYFSVLLSRFALHCPRIWNDVRKNSIEVATPYKVVERIYCVSCTKYLSVEKPHGDGWVDHGELSAAGCTYIAKNCTNIFTSYPILLRSILGCGKV